jgi:16S rRNA (adenine1518-N6/adenine1519-N6)-dimethyltransferase
LVSGRVYRAIVDATVSSEYDWVVEIGAGLGTLTARIAARLTEGKVIAVERDRDMCVVLRGELEHYDNVEIAESNALTYDLSAVARWAGAPIAVCGNLPYQIASQILFRIIDARQHVARAVVMLQKEMAERLLAEPGTKTYGGLTVLIGTYGVVRRVVNAPPNAFIPPPRVDSTVISFVPHPGGQPLVEIADHEHYRDVVHAAFATRRKTLRNSIKNAFPACDVDAVLSSADIDGVRRGETLSIAEFAALAKAIPVPVET